MDTTPVHEHPFDLTRLKAGDTFLGCPSCGFRYKEPVAAVPQCPQCGQWEMKIYTVTPEDITT